MTSTTRPAMPFEDSEEFGTLLAQALTQIDQDGTVDIDALAAAHPEFADQLSSFFFISNEVGALLGEVQASGGRVSTLPESDRSTASLDERTVRMISELPERDLAEPTHIGKYVIRGRLGMGSFGVVYLALDPLLNRMVAIKVPATGDSVSERHRQNFLDEAQKTALLEHEHIVRIYEVHREPDGAISLVYQYVPGPTLCDVISDNNYTREEAVRWTADIADALHYAHKRGVVHRDIKPSNILMSDADGRRQPLLVDFGLALLRHEKSHDGRGQIVGAYAYMSPEQARGEAQWATAQSDIFSLGVVLYELLCHRRPWRGSGKVILREIQSRHPEPLRVLDESIPAEVERICLKALAKSPEARYTTAGDFGKELRAAIGPKSARRGWRTPLLAAAAAASAVVAATFVFLAAGPAVRGPSVIPVQEVRLAMRIQPVDPGVPQPGRSFELSADTDGVNAADGWQIHTRTATAQPGYLYCLWYRPKGEVTLLPASSSDAFAEPRPAIQQPSADDQVRWDSLGKGSVGLNLVIAFTKSSPLTQAEQDELKSATWVTSHSELAAGVDFARVGWPDTNQEPVRTMRGGEANNDSVPLGQEKFLGQVGSILKDKLDCYYQGIIFRVHPKEAGN